MKNCNIYGQTWKGNGVINVGGMVGQIKLSNITNGYVQNTKINAYNIESKKSSYALGGLVGLVTSNKDTVSTISYCLTYANSFNTQNGTFGYMAGKSTANNSFANCYFESSNNRAVNNSSMNGCKALRKISLKNIGDAKFNTDWTTDEQGNVILKKHI